MFLDVVGIRMNPVAVGGLGDQDIAARDPFRIPQQRQAPARERAGVNAGPSGAEMDRRRPAQAGLGSRAAVAGAVGGVVRRGSRARRGRLGAPRNRDSTAWQKTQPAL